MFSLISITPETLGLLFLLGMRHGLDPDHIAVIDNITFRALDERPKAAGWTGFLFSAGHTVSVLVIAALFGILGEMVTLPPQFETGMAFFITGLLLVIGTLNLRALISKDAYVPMGWRHGLLPKLLRGSTHPLVTVAIGLAFGLAIDTAAQVAAWGTAASSVGGLVGAIAVGLSFAAGMILTDSFDSLVVARLVSGNQNARKARNYRRCVGWVIVALSYGMAAYSILELIHVDLPLSEITIALVGAGMAGLVVLVAFLAQFNRRKPKRSSQHEM
jgi:high-affinity nickel-transport protein